MENICHNKECDYWTRGTNGECDAGSFCGGFMAYEGEQKEREKTEAGNNVKRPHMHNRTK